MMRLALIVLVAACAGCRSMERENYTIPPTPPPPTESATPPTPPPTGVVVPFETFSDWQEAIGVYLPRMIGRGDSERARVLLIRIGRSMGWFGAAFKRDANQATPSKIENAVDPFAPTIDRSDKALATLPK